MPSSVAETIFYHTSLQHDDTVMALLYAMNVVKQPFLVPYAAAVFIDLYQDEHDRHYVEVSYKNNTPSVVPCNGQGMYLTLVSISPAFIILSRMQS